MSILIQLIFGVFSIMICLAVAYVAYKDKRTTDSFSRFFLICFFGIISPIFFGYITYNNITNPCLEFEDTCEIECWGEGTPAYDCDCIYPCKKRKND